MVAWGVGLVLFPTPDLEFFGGVCVANFCFVFCVVLLCVFMFWVPRGDVCYDFCIKTMFGSSLPPVVCRRAHVLFKLFVFAWNSGDQHMLCCVFALFFFILCTQCCQFLWIVHFCLALQYFLIVCLQSVDGISDLGDPFRMLKQFSFIKG